MVDEATSATSGEHWFSKPGQEILFYRINRRPLGGVESLFSATDSVLEHLARVLGASASATSGTRFHRIWRLGDLAFLDRARGFTGRLGWARTREALAQTWNPESHGWEDQVAVQTDSGVSPIAFDSASRVLGILKHPSFTNEQVLAKVLTHILNEGELVQDFPATDWSVEPLGDVKQFEAWLSKVDHLFVLRTVFKRPNPDAEEAFAQIFARLDAVGAEQLREEIRADKKSSGLNKVEVQRDRTTQGYLVAALQHAFGYVWARGTRKGKTVTFDQRRTVLRSSVDDVGATWQDATKTVLLAVERRGLKHLAKHEHGDNP